MWYAVVALAVVLAVALVAVVVGWRRSAREIRRLAGELPSLPASARFGGRLHTSGGARARDLARAVNDLVDDYEAIRRQGLALEESIRLSVAGIAHDLRTPLTSLSGYLQLLESSDDPETTARYQRAIAQSVATLRTLNENFYELSLLELGQDAPEPVPVDLEREVTEALLAHADEFEHLGLDVDLAEWDGPPLMALADAATLRRVIGNLVQNLLRYADDWVHVEFAAQDACVGSTGDEARVGVTIANRTDHPLPADIDRIFDRFTTADPSRGGEGLGLGLYVSRSLLAAQGGAIQASRRDDTLDITVWLPRASGMGTPDDRRHPVG